MFLFFLPLLLFPVLLSCIIFIFYSKYIWEYVCVYKSIIQYVKLAECRALLLQLSLVSLLGPKSTTHSLLRSLDRYERIRMQELICEEHCFLQHSGTYSCICLLSKYLLSLFARFWRYCGIHTDTVSTFIELMFVVGQCF